jgi:hypothetical protein
LICKFTRPGIMRTLKVINCQWPKNKFTFSQKYVKTWLLALSPFLVSLSTFLDGSFVFLDMGPSILFLVSPPTSPFFWGALVNLWLEFHNLVMTI